MFRKFRKHRRKNKIQQPPEKKPITTVEVSIIGGEYDKYVYNGPIPPVGTFIFIKPKGEEHEILVKVRGMSSRPVEKEIESMRIAPDREVARIMRNMTKGYLWEHEEYRDIKITKTEFDAKTGYIKFDYIAERKHKLSKFSIRLAKLLHVRVEFTQVGARDYAKEIGGIGPCGRELCCKSFLKEIPSVTLDMARQQYLFAAPEKLSGVCGRLMCCLRFELPVYEELSRIYPHVGSRIQTPKGVARVVEINVLTGRARVRYEEDNSEEVLDLSEESEEKVEWQPVK